MTEKEKTRPVSKEKREKLKQLIKTSSSLRSALLLKEILKRPLDHY